MLTLAVAGLASTLLFGVLMVVAFMLPQAGVAGVALGAGALGAVAVATWALLRLRAWPPGRLGLFRDRILVIHGNREMRAAWSAMESVTLSEPGDWPGVRLTDRLTIHLRNEPALAFKPALFGLEPVGCRDLILRLRDDAGLRSRLPEFDSLRDLTMSPIVAGELIEPRL